MRPFLPAILLALLLSGCATPPEGKGMPADDVLPPAASEPIWQASMIEGEATFAPLPQSRAELFDHDAFLLPASIEARLDIALDGDLPPGASVRFLPPGCKEATCWTEVPLAGGKASLALQEPAAGAWSFVFSGQAAAPAHATYRLDVLALAPPPPPLSGGAWNAEVWEGEVLVTPFVPAQRLLAGSQPFQVPLAEAVWLNLTLEGPLAADAKVRYTPPGCQEPSCAHETDMARARAQLRIDGPPPGEWTLAFLDGRTLVPSHAAYHLQVTAYVTGPA